MNEIVRKEDSPSKGAWVVERDGKRLAEMTYSAAGSDKIIIDHTDVSDALRGTGTGGKLVAAAVEWARANGKKILPLCPFAKSVFDKNPAYRDVLFT
jgi:predicted GNAT family acetyltransferase